MKTLFEKLSESINKNDQFSIAVIIERILQSNTEEVLLEYLQSNNLLSKMECQFCEIKCENTECNLIPKGEKQC